MHCKFMTGCSPALHVPAGWMDVRLLAPRAELRVQIGGGSSMVDAGRLSYLGEALRALLVLEVRCIAAVRQSFSVLHMNLCFALRPSYLAEALRALLVLEVRAALITNRSLFVYVWRCPQQLLCNLGACP
jgi:hypothetical protein